MSVPPPRVEGLGFSFPYADWQFWAVTLIALVAVGWLLRGFRPGRRRRRRGRRVNLTVGGRTPRE